MELYIHIPFCSKKCAYCDFLSAPHDKNIRAKYTEALCREIRSYAVKDTGVIDTVFFGGGTPSWLELPLMRQIIEAIDESFEIDQEAEVTIECNPGTVTKDAMNTYARWGFNRISIGLQSANEDELALLGRIHSYEHFLKTYELARNAGIKNINIDIMTGLPGQTPQKLLKTLKQVLMLKPEHISAYSLMIEEGTPFYEAYGEDAKRQAAGEKTLLLPNEDELCELTDLCISTLKEHGYMQYEISNFAKEGMECRHNIGYWKRVPYIGVGLGAASFYDHKRYANERDIYKYMDAPGIREVTALSRDDEMAEFMFLGLRMNEGISRKDFEELFGEPLWGVYGDALRKLAEEELIEAKKGRVFLTKRGREVSNIAFADFLK